MSEDELGLITLAELFANDAHDGIEDGKRAAGHAGLAPVAADEPADEEKHQAFKKSLNELRWNTWFENMAEVIDDHGIALAGQSNDLEAGSKGQRAMEIWMQGLPEVTDVDVELNLPEKIRNLLQLVL